jgi:D-alanyl-D-alanine dipeptidase
MFRIFLIVFLLGSHTAFAQTCPQPLASARRLVLVTANGMSTNIATLQNFERASPGEPWRAASAAEPVLIGKRGMAWAHAFRQFAGKEPIKVEGDKRVPAGFYTVGKSFGTAPSSRPGHVHVRHGMRCIDDPASPAYNKIVTRGDAGWAAHGENMWRAPEYKSGLLVDYPSDAKARAGSCIFIHVRLPASTGTAGCVALPEARLSALQDFTAPGAVLAILPQQARDRFKGCLP